jgi:hypothetical protein
MDENQLGVATLRHAISPSLAPRAGVSTWNETEFHFRDFKFLRLILGIC